MKLPTEDEHLNDYVDGLLSDEAARQFEIELAQNPALRAEEQALRRLIDDASFLPKGVPPRRDLWPGIEERLAERPAANIAKPVFWQWIRPFAAVAAAVLIFAAGMWYAKTTDHFVPPQIATTIVPVVPHAELASFKEIDSAYADVRTSLRAAVDNVRPTLAPETVKIVDENLAIVDQAIKDIEGALATDPSNQTLIRSLVAAYDQEVGLLRQVTEIAEHPGEDKA